MQSPEFIPTASTVRKYVQETCLSIASRVWSVCKQNLRKGFVHTLFTEGGLSGGEGGKQDSVKGAKEG